MDKADYISGKKNYSRETQFRVSMYNAFRGTYTPLQIQQDVSGSNAQPPPNTKRVNRSNMI